ncbi:MAG: nucleotide exchange factor GrpE [Pseudomonadota bacterium]
MAKQPDSTPETEAENPTPEQEATAEVAGELAPEGPSVEDLMPGLADAVAAEDAAALTAQIDALEVERAELKDRLIRALAETENVRKRAERDRRDAETYGGTKLARDLLSVHDNLDRALKAADNGLREAHGPFLEGVELTSRELLNAFAKHKIAPVQPATGEKFDPNRHQAMFEAPIPGATPGTIIEVMQSGFTIADRLLRPALVGIAKAPPKPAEPKDDAAPDADDAATDTNT